MDFTLAAFPTRGKQKCSCNSSNDGLKEVARLRHLTLLDPVATKVSDVGIKELAALPELANLYVALTKVTPEGIAALRKALPKCKIGN